MFLGGSMQTKQVLAGEKTYTATELRLRDRPAFFAAFKALREADAESTASLDARVALLTLGLGIQAPEAEALGLTDAEKLVAAVLEVNTPPKAEAAPATEAAPPTA